MVQLEMWRNLLEIESQHTEQNAVPKDTLFLFDFNLDPRRLNQILETLKAKVGTDFRHAYWSNYSNSVMHSLIRKSLPEMDANINITRDNSSSSLADLLGFMSRNLPDNGQFPIVVIVSKESKITPEEIESKLSKKGKPVVIEIATVK